jgi:hypothetical protein
MATTCRPGLYALALSASGLHRLQPEVHFMATTWAVRLAAPLAATAMIVGCSKGSHSSAGTRDDLGGSKYQTLSLKGCVEEAPGSKEYVLRRVQVDPVSMQRSDAPSSQGLTVTDGSWVRLHDSSDQLKAHLGQMVSISGTIIDDGRNTIGTSGKATDPDEAESPVDKSRAASSEHHAAKETKEAGPIGRVSQSNGSVPEISVERVTATGQSCGNAAPKSADR